LLLTGTIFLSGQSKTKNQPEEFSPVPLLTDRSERSPLHGVFKKTEATEDPSWKTEVLAEKAKQQLKKLAKLLFKAPRKPFTDEELSKIVYSSFEGETIYPDLEEVYRSPSFLISRKTSTGPVASFRPAVQIWRNSIKPGRIDGEAAIRWKVIAVEELEDGFSTDVRLEIDGASPSGSRMSQIAELTCQWTGDQTPLLRTWKIKRFEEIQLLASSPTPFLDHAVGLMKHEKTYSDQLALGADYWYGNFDVAFGVQQGNQGISICDINSDGREDLFVCQPAGLPSRMYLQQEDGGLKDVTEKSGLNWLDDARSALFVDLDGDGDEDLALGLGYSLTIHENDGQGRFRLRVEIDMYSWPASLATADYDNDGDLDLYFCGYTPRNDVEPGDLFANPVPYQDANNGARNFFIENLGSFDFADITAKCGLSENNRRFSFAASWEDYDQDGDQDLYVANDFGRNNLYRNDLLEDGSRRFVDVAAEAGVEDVAAGMSVSWGDCNRDGLPDLYISNMFSSAGGRIAFQRQFQNASKEEIRAQLQRHARGNTLYQNRGDGTFADVSVESGVTMGRWAWASHFVDLNNDAWEDLVVTNGFHTTEDTGDL
jgi:hypothetical protein